ncbi:MAG: hypothetical protein GXO15_06425 [Crenarchaeota archaeon]|nr:hypothetical protein [Thermoproteota archaeon]
MAAAARRRVVERRMKEVLLEAARRAGVDPGELAEWLSYAAGVRAEASWSSVRRAVLRPEVSAQELAAFLVTEGVEVPEGELLEALGEVFLGGRAPRLPRGAAGAGGASGQAHGQREGGGRSRGAAGGEE